MPVLGGGTARIQELKRPGVTLQLLWEEYGPANELAYKYTSFCVKYRAWAEEGVKRSMRQTHVAGEKLFVDYAGDTMPIVDAATGEIRQAQIFVAAQGRGGGTKERRLRAAASRASSWVSPSERLKPFGGTGRSPLFLVHETSEPPGA